MDNLEIRYGKHPAIVSREIAGEVILVPIRQNVGDLESIYTLNETAACVWSLIDGQRSVRDLRDALVNEFQVSVEEAQRDLFDLLARLESIGAISQV